MHDLLSALREIASEKDHFVSFSFGAIIAYPNSQLLFERSRGTKNVPSSPHFSPNELISNQFLCSSHPINLTACSPSKCPVECV